MHASVRRHHDGSVELFDYQWPLLWRVVQGAPVDNRDRNCGLAARERDATLAPARVTGPRCDLHIVEIEPVLAEASARDTHLHQFDRGFVAVAVHLEVLGDEAFANVGELLALEGDG